MRKLIGLLAVMGLALLSLAGTAAASSNLPNGSSIDGTGTSVDLGGLITCHSTVRGTIFNKPAGQGIHGIIHSATFNPCVQAGVSATATTLPWTLDVTGTTNGGVTWDGVVTDVNVDVSIFSGAVRCRYTGNVGALFENVTMRLTLSGSLSSSTGGLCPANSAVQGTYHISPTLTLS